MMKKGLSKKEAVGLLRTNNGRSYDKYFFGCNGEISLEVKFKKKKILEEQTLNVEN